MKEEGTKRRGSETEAKTESATTLGVAEEATTASAGNNRACSNGRDREDEFGSGERCRTRGRCSSKTGSLYYGGGLGTELLCLWGFWAYGLTLQESRTEREGGGE